MGKVVCATRAGEHSRRVHQAAFELVARPEDSIVFVHVLGGEDFEAQSEGMQRAIHTEVGWLVETLVRLAQHQSGVDSEQVSTEIVEGEPATALIDFLRVSAADHLVMGRPRNGAEGTFAGSAFDDFMRSVAELDVTVELVETSQ